MSMYVRVSLYIYSARDLSPNLCISGHILFSDCNDYLLGFPPRLYIMMAADFELFCCVVHINNLFQKWSDLYNWSPIWGDLKPHHSKETLEMKLSGT